MRSVGGKIMIASRVHLAAVLLASTACIAAPAAQAQSGQGQSGQGQNGQGQNGQGQQRITIAAQPLDAALQQLMAQTGVVISYPSALSAGKRSAAVANETAAIPALSRLLQGTGLTYRQTGANSFTLESGPVAADDG